MNYSAKPSRKSFESRLQSMVDHIRTDIYTGALAPGEYLPSEKALTTQYNLSNKSVRKGLETLVSEQLIVKLDRVGSRVSDFIPGSKSTIILGFSPSIERDIGLSALLKDFHSIYPDKYVKTVSVKLAADYEDNMKEYFDHLQIDVFTINNLDFQGIIEHDNLNLLEPMPVDPNSYAFAEAAFIHNHALYARPLIFSPIVLAYNQAHFREAGVPEPDSSWNWENCLRHAAALTSPGKRHGLYFYLLSDNRWPAFLLQSGMGFEPDENGSFQLAGTRLLECIRLCKRIITDQTIYPSYLSENSEDVSDLFLQGRVSMVVTNYMTMNDLKATDLEYDISPLPYLYEPRSLLNVIGLAIYKNSKNKEVAKLLAEYLISPRAQQIIHQQTLSLPARREVAERLLEPHEGMNRPSRFALFREIMPSYKLHHELNLSNASFVGLRQLLKKYWSGLIDDDQLCIQVNEMFIRLRKILSPRH